MQIEYPDFATLPAHVKEKFENLPTKVNFFGMMGYSPDTFVEIIDLTNAIFKNLTLNDYHKELVVLSVASYADATYEWEQHVSASRWTTGSRSPSVRTLPHRHLCHRRRPVISSHAPEPASQHLSRSVIHG